MNLYNREDAIENVKLLTGENNENLIILIVKKAEQTIKSIGSIDVEDAPEEIGDIVEDIACLRYNQMGREGLSGESLGKNSISISNDIPQILKQKIYSFRIPKVI